MIDIEKLVEEICEDYHITDKKIKESIAKTALEFLRTLRGREVIKIPTKDDRPKDSETMNNID